MAGAGDIRAGNAYVTLGLRGGAAFTAGLRKASQQLKDFGAGGMRIGQGIMNAGRSITDALGSAVNQFAQVGSEINDMAGRTGMSTDALQELGYAASQTGAEIGDVEIGSKKLSKAISEAAEGSKTASDTFADLGLSLADLQKMTPEQQFDATAKALAGVQDPTKRAALAMEVFGKSGTKLLPMIDNMEALRQKARDLGIILTPEQVKAADDLGDAMDDVKLSVGGLINQIGAALAESITEAAQAMTQIIAAAGRWIKENKELVVTVAKIAAVVTGVGAAIVALSAVVFGVGFAWSAAIAAATGFTAVLAAIVSPLGLLIGTLVAVGVAFFKFSDTGKAALKSLMDFFAPMVKLATDTFQGIKDALIAGDIGLAGQIAMAGLKVAFLSGTSAIGGIFGDFLGSLAQQILSGDFAGAWETVISGMTSVWSEFAAGVTSMWGKTIQSITEGIFALVKRFPKLGKMILGVDLEGEAEKHRSGLFNRAKLLTAEALKVEATDPERAKQLREQAAAARREAGGVTQDTLFDEAAKGAQADLQKNIDAARQKAEQARADFGQRIAGKGDQSAVDAAQAELDKLLQEAADKKAAQQAKIAAAAGGAPGAGGAAGAPSDKLFGTFSAAAALAIARPGAQANNPQQKAAQTIVTEMKVWNREEDKRHKKLLDTIKANSAKIGA